MIRYSTLLNIREMRFKTTMWCHLTLVRMTIIKKSTNNTCWRRCGEKGTLSYLLWECKLTQPLRRTVWRFLKKKQLRIKLTYDPTILVLGIYPEKTTVEKDTCTLLFIAALFTIVKWSHKEKNKYCILMHIYRI